jgi:hypothetical protein
MFTIQLPTWSYFSNEHGSVCYRNGQILCKKKILDGGKCEQLTASFFGYLVGGLEHLFFPIYWE